MAETAIFMEVDGGRIKGSSTASFRVDWIVVDTVDFGITREPKGGGHGASHADWKSNARAEAEPVTIRKKACLATCGLFTDAAGDEPIKKIVIDICAPTSWVPGDAGNLRWYLSFEMEQCVILSYSIELDDEGAPVETSSSTT